MKETERKREKERILLKSNHYNENKNSKFRVYTSQKVIEITDLNLLGQSVIFSPQATMQSLETMSYFLWV